jgi:hypothetical protein
MFTHPECGGRSASSETQMNDQTTADIALFEDLRGGFFSRNSTDRASAAENGPQPNECEEESPG